MSHRIVVTEIKPAQAPQSAVEIATTTPTESKVFEQVVEDFNLGKFVRMVNPVTRRSRAKKGEKNG